MKWLDNLLDVTAVDFVSGFYAYLISVLLSILLVVPLVKAIYE